MEDLKPIVLCQPVIWKNREAKFMVGQVNIQKNLDRLYNANP